MKTKLKWLLFPGLNLHARLRNRVLPEHFGQPSNGEARNVLDAGCGNGMLAYQSYKRGNIVLGVSIKDEVQRNQRLFNDTLAIPPAKLKFRAVNLYDIETLDQTFDEIICTEVMEHVRGDRQVCASFFKILKPGGLLHICCPNADHSYHNAYPLDPHENGGHVRPGYTYETYKQLLEPIGFVLSDPIGLGGPIRQSCNVFITRCQETCGLGLGVLMFLLLSPWAVLDTSHPKLPFSLYVRATRPQTSNGVEGTQRT